MSSSETFEAALSPFQADGLVDDVLRVLKSGKEGTVYCCRADIGCYHDNARAALPRLLRARLGRKRDGHLQRADA